jgi:hypothetical protein
MAETADPTGAAPAPIAAIAGAPPPPAVVPNLYDPNRNRACGVVTMEEVQAEFSGNQDALAARIRQDKGRRHQKTMDDAVERASDGVRMKALKDKLKGTKRSTEIMIHMTGWSTPTSQTSIAYGENFPWAAPRLRILAERSLIEAEPDTGVAPFVMPSDQLIIEIGQEEAKKAGAWGVPQVLLINPARAMVEVVDLPKNVGWKNGRAAPFPWWKDDGPLAPPWHDFHLYTEVPEPNHPPDLQPAWTLDLYIRDGAPVMMHARAFVVRCQNKILASAGNARDPFTPHVTFIAAQTAADATGKQHATLDEIAGALTMAPHALIERLRHEGYLNLRGEATPAALDAGITTIVDGGTQFCFDAIEGLIGATKAGGTEVDQGAETADATPTELPGEPDVPKAGIDQVEATVEVATTGESGRRDADAPKVEVNQADETADGAAESETEESEEAANPTKRAQRVSVWQGGGMRQVTAQQKDRSVADGEMDKPPIESGSVDDAAFARQAADALLTAQEAMCRRTEEGEFVPHSGDNQTLRNRIKTAALAMSAAGAALTSLAAAYKTLQKNSDVSSQRLEAENMELKRRLQEMQARIAGLEPGSGAYAEVLSFVRPDVDDDAATAASH